MTRFTQLHVLTFYPPSNLNRDDSGRPKTAIVGGTNRLRISSQCLKRAWRTSPVFGEELAGHLGTRTKKIGSKIVMPRLIEAGIDEKKASEWAREISGCFAKIKKDEIDTPQLVHLSKPELDAIKALTATLAAEKRAPSAEELAILSNDRRTADIALFGRMLAEHAAYNIDAACQVAHAVTVNKVSLEDDFFTAVDDLNRHADEEGAGSGAGHVDELWFGSGVFYLYLCINRDLLAENLGGDEELAGRAVKALTRAVCTISPGGKQNSFAALSHAGFVHAEKGSAQPRSLALAFMTSIDHGNLLDKAVDRFCEQREKLDSCYETGPDQSVSFSPYKGEGRLGELLDFVGEA